MHDVNATCAVLRLVMLQTHKESALETVVCEQCVEVSQLHGVNTRNRSAYQSLFGFVTKSLNETQ